MNLKESREILKNKLIRIHTEMKKRREDALNALDQIFLGSSINTLSADYIAEARTHCMCFNILLDYTKLTKIISYDEYEILSNGNFDKFTP